MSNKALVDELKRLFIHRYDAHIKVDLKTRNWINKKEPLTNELLHQHVNGELTVGSYCPGTDSMSKILMFDVDDHKKEDDKYTSEEIPGIIKKITKRLIKYRLHPFIQMSGLNNGQHIWVSIQPTPAKDVRIFGKRLLEEIGLDKLGLEVYPKTDEITKTKPYGIGYGLPFGKHRTTEIIGDLLFKNYKKKSNFKYRGDKPLKYLQKIKPEVLPHIPGSNVDNDDEDVDFVFDKETDKKTKTPPTTEEWIEKFDTIDDNDIDDKIKSMMKKLVRAKSCTQSIYVNKIQLNGEHGHLARVIIMRELILIDFSPGNVHTYFESQDDYSKTIVNKKFEEEITKLEKERDKIEKKELAKQIKVEAEGRKYFKNDKNYRPFVRCRIMTKNLKHIKELDSTCEACMSAYVSKNRANNGETFDYVKDVFLPLFIDKWKIIKKHGIESKDKKYILISREDIMKCLNLTKNSYSGYMQILKINEFIKMNKNLNQYHRINYYKDKGKNTTQVIMFDIEIINSKMKRIKKIKR